MALVQGAIGEQIPFPLESDVHGPVCSKKKTGYNESLSWVKPISHGWHMLGDYIGYRSWILLGMLMVLTACLGAPKPPPMEAAARHYIPDPEEGLLSRYAPAFWVEKAEIDYNRPGAVRASSPEEIFIDPDTPALYAEQRQFSTSKGEYTNLIYRVHFKEIPGGFSPYYLGAGKNVGLLIIVTLDTENRPRLLTTLHTCGCYLAFIPATNLPPEARPSGWPVDRQIVYGENLPAELDFGNTPLTQVRMQIRIRPDTHRVMDVWLASTDNSSQSSARTALQPLEDLKHLPLGNGQTTSFYESSGSRTGHVKGSFKPRERFFMSWWTLAWDIGQDKYLGENPDDGPVFFTSLQPWAREASDLRDFPKFLRFWGWDL